MNAVNIAEGKARFSELVARAEAGEEVIVARRGKPVVKLVAVEQPRKPIDIEALRAITNRMPMQKKTAAEFIREMRDSDRY